MTEPTAERQTATPATGTTGTTTTAQPIVFSPVEKLRIESDARRAVSSRPMRRF